MSLKKPLVINLFAGPGAGKSTTAALVFGYLKQNHCNVELVTEYAKELVWEERTKTLSNQIYLLGKQSNRMSILENKVDAIITDSPLLLCSIYKNENYPKEFDNIVKWQFDQFDNMNWFLNRKKEFNPRGRVHTLEQSIEIDNDIKEMLTKHNQYFKEVDGDEEGVETIKKNVLGLIGIRKSTR